MNKQEFLDQLRRNISSINDYEFINDTIAYYQDYIESEIRKGATEQDVLNTLGDPRLIAKSILATHEFGKEENQGTENRTTNTSETAFSHKGKAYHIPTWLFRVAIWAVIIIVLVIAFFIVQSLFPVIVIFALVYFLFKFIRETFWSN